MAYLSNRRQKARLAGFFSYRLFVLLLFKTAANAPSRCGMAKTIARLIDSAYSCAWSSFGISRISE